MYSQRRVLGMPGPAGLSATSAIPPFTNPARPTHIPICFNQFRPFGMNALLYTDFPLVRRCHDA